MTTSYQVTKTALKNVKQQWLYNWGCFWIARKSTQGKKPGMTRLRGSYEPLYRYYLLFDV